MTTAGADVQITDLAVDDHACLTFGEAEELFDLTAAFVRDGLAGGLKVVWVTEAGPQRATPELARRGVPVESALADGQMTVAGCEECLLSGQAFSAGEAMRWLSGQMAASQHDGFDGLRIAMDMNWALRPVSGVEELPEFEEGMAAALAGTTASVLCQYDRERFDPVTLATVAPFHTRSVAAATYYADPLLRICRQYAPPGVRVAGEIDYRREEPLALALAEAIRLDGEAIRLDGNVTINLADLTFIDGPCARMILDAAYGLAASRSVDVRCHPAITDTFVLLGARDVAGVSLVSVDDR